LIKMMKRINSSSLALLSFLAFAAMVSALPAVAMPAGQSRRSSQRQIKASPSQDKVPTNRTYPCKKCLDLYTACVKKQEKIPVGAYKHPDGGSADFCKAPEGATYPSMAEALEARAIQHCYDDCHAAQREQRAKKRKPSQ
jgi:hypothetical protein